MSFLSWGPSCGNTLLPLVNFFSAIARLAFIVVCFLIVLELGRKVYKDGKILFSLIGVLILALVFIIVTKILPDLFMEQYVNIESGIYWSDVSATPEEKLWFSRRYIELWLFGVPVISYIYYKICRYICSVKKLSKKVLYALYGILLVILAVVPLMFFKSYDYFIENINSYNDCW